MNLSLILALILAAILGLGGAGAVGYRKGAANAELKAQVAMDAHLAADAKAEQAAKEEAISRKDKLIEAQNAVSAAYEKGKNDAEAAAKRTIADLRNGTVVMRERWTACKTSADLPATAAGPGECARRETPPPASARRSLSAARSCPPDLCVETATWPARHRE